MRYITEAELREQFSSGLPACYELPSGCMLTPSARQYLMDLKLYQQGMEMAQRMAARLEGAQRELEEIGAGKPGDPPEQTSLLDSAQ